MAFEDARKRDLALVGFSVALGALLNLLFTHAVGASDALVLSKVLSKLFPLNASLALVGLAAAINCYADFLLRRFEPCEIKKLIALMAVCGGSVYLSKREGKYCARIYGRDRAFHDIFSDLVSAMYGARPSTVTYRGKYLITQAYSKRLTEDIAHLAPYYRSRGASPARLHFLNGESKDLLIEAVRLVASITGSIGFSVAGNGDVSYVRPRLTFGCLSHAETLDDLSKLLSAVGLSAFRVYDKRFSKGYLATTSWKNVEAFDKLGGFIRGFKVRRGALAGVEKQSLLKLLLSVHERGLSPRLAFTGQRFSTNSYRVRSGCS